MFRTIYYYQTFTDLTPVLDNSYAVSVLNIASIHLGRQGDDNEPYIHLNDHPPNDSIFDTMWAQTKQASEKGIKIMLMVGGAGLAYQALFSDFGTFYPMLKAAIKDHDWISGIDLDIEEEVELQQVINLITTIRSDFGSDFTITMAPVAGAIKNDEPGLGGFIYKDLYTSPVGKEISWFNVQAYGSYTADDYAAMVANGYPASHLVFGMLYSQFDSSTFDQAVSTVKALRVNFPSMAGVFVWEYFLAPPGGKADPIEWAKLMHNTSSSPNVQQKLCTYM